MALLPFRPASSEAAEVESVLRDDLAFASVFELAREGESTGDADLLVSAELSEERDRLLCRLRVQAPGDSTALFHTEYTAPGGAARRLAHRIADDLLANLGLEGVAETRIAFVSERSGEGRALFLMDYDGYRQEAIAEPSFLVLSPRWHPEGDAVSYVSFPTKGRPPALRMSNRAEPLFESEAMVFSSAWSPDGSRIAFSSSHEGNAEIYVMRGDGTDLRRLTDHPEIDVSPTWSPTGREIAFTSTRTGSPQIYAMDGEGLNLRRVSPEGTYNAEPAWSPSKETSEIAYASRGAGGGFDIVVVDLLTRQSRKLIGDGAINESPSWAPNGRHLVFSSTRTGSPQIFTIHRDGTGVRQLTFEGENRTPSWSPR